MPALRTSSPPLPGNRVYATYARAPEIKNRSGESCGSSVVEHSLGKGEAESSILSRSTTTFEAFVETILTGQRLSLPKLLSIAKPGAITEPESKHDELP
jgi:hypothetical protein